MKDIVIRQVYYFNYQIHMCRSENLSESFKYCPHGISVGNIICHIYKSSLEIVRLMLKSFF